MSGVIDYDDLMAAYQADLVDTLRGFGAQSELLELWVPDEDPVRSLANMVDAAAAAGAERLSVRVGPATAPAIDRAALLAALDGLGKVALAEEPGGFLLAVCGLGKEVTENAVHALAVAEDAVVLEAGSTVDDRPITQPAQIAAPYRAALAGAVTHMSHEGTAGDLRAEVDGAVLTLAVTDHRVRAARHTGGRTDLARALLDRFCALIEGLPIQEAADHGAVRLEFDLRAADAVPVPGVITPAAADPAFRLPQALIRQALAAHRAATGWTDTGNDYDTRPGPAWTAASDWERREMLAEALMALGGERGFDPEDVVLHAIEHDVRVVVELRGALAAGDCQPHMMMLEAGIKQKVDRRLELFQRERVDENAIRRLGADGTGESP
ncbi:MAG: hypothetical protein H6907_18060 [Hyphomicrobiales bacterium]|nr:hypothetical protein [Hyphomicrobiales bacterium]MCP5373639.1 hypothetical protein [Hyphomicrobiales bacterium]